ncbi:hypothetical protein VCHA54P499_70107 [Vibrio chagasii]|nr:hypothetical protein VCHA54P499_70107 [Vibrio chagasii]CAH7466454.1 hypothetical protein VCHA53O466_90154 [Vibrio chagasii]
MKLMSIKQLGALPVLLKVVVVLTALISPPYHQVYRGSWGFIRLPPIYNFKSFRYRCFGSHNHHKSGGYVIWETRNRLNDRSNSI